MSRNSKGLTSKEKEKSGKDRSEVWACELCMKEFRDENSKVLECERCEGHRCAKCLKLTDEAYEVLTSRSDFHWFCGGCEPKVLQAIQLEKEIEAKLSDVMSKMDYKLKISEGNVYKKFAELEESLNEKSKNYATRNDLKSMDEEINRVKTEVDKQLMIKCTEMQELSSKVKEIYEGQEGEWTHVVKKQVSSALESVNDNINEVQYNLSETRAEAQEQREKENRRNNVVLYNIPESNGARADDRNKEDAAFCLQLFSSLQVGVSEEDLIRVFRLGKRSDSSDQARPRPRPVMIHFGSYSIKNLVMESLFKLRHAEQKFKGIIVTHDMTRKERDECKNLVGLAKQQEAQDTSGEYMYRVRGRPGNMNIKKIRIRQ